jgi:hypothetical protein
MQPQDNHLNNCYCSKTPHSTTKEIIVSGQSLAIDLEKNSVCLITPFKSDLLQICISLNFILKSFEQIPKLSFLQHFVRSHQQLRISGLRYLVFLSIGFVFDGFHPSRKGSPRLLIVFERGMGISIWPIIPRLDSFDFHHYKDFECHIIVL